MQQGHVFVELVHIPEVIVLMMIIIMRIMMVRTRIG